MKPKQNPILCAPEKKRRKKKNQDAPEVDPPEEDDWVMVKKQRVTIFIPPLPAKVQSAIPNVAEPQPQENPEIANSKSPTKTNSHSQCSLGISVLKQHEHKKPMLLPPDQTVQPTEIVHHAKPRLPPQEPLSVPHRDVSGNSPILSFRDGREVGDNGTSKMSKRSMIFVDTNVFLDRRMRASYLEKKLIKAGGLEDWLFSLGLSCFTEVFQKRMVHKFHLANLSMKKLKDMGVYAVGPRRKLLHAIDCLCSPHCFQHM